MMHPLNRYGNYDLETNESAREYECRQYEREEGYWCSIDREIERDYFGVSEED